MNNIISRHYGLIDPFFDELFNDKGYRTSDMMKTDIKEEGDHYELKVEVPEIKKEDLKLSLEDGYLTINATFKDENDEKSQGKYIRRERRYGNYTRSFYVGDSLKEEDIKAKLNDGVLYLNVPKEETVKKVEEKKYISID